MKKLLLLLVLMSGTSAAWAQPQLPGFSMSREQNLDWPRWKAGQRGAKVRALQLVLNDRGARVRVDGYFGRATQDAVRRFQGHHGLVADGVVGAQTWEKLVIPLRLGARGNSVRALRLLLALHGNATKKSDTFDQSLQNAVRHYQQKAGEGLMISNGRASLWVWCWLLGGSNVGD